MIKRLVAEEREAVVLLSAISTALRRYGSSVAKMAERRGADPESATKIRDEVEDLIDKVLTTAPVEQLVTVRNQMLMSDIHIGIRNAKRPDDYWLITYEEATELANALVESKCLLCEKSTNERCPVRDLLDSLPVDDSGASGWKLHCRGGI